MNERPILFSDPMIRAILAGHKTQTRRVVQRRKRGSPVSCPYGQPGDVLWVRQAWHIRGPERRLQYATGPWDFRFRAEEPEGDGSLRWRPSIHMPRMAANIFLEVTAVRIESLQEISDEDIAAEDASVNSRKAFVASWDQINGKRAGCDWGFNPLVWVISFRLMGPPETTPLIGVKKQ